MDIKDCIIYEKTIPAHPAVYDDFPENPDHQSGRSVEFRGGVLL